MQTVKEKLTEQGIKTDNITWVENVPSNKQSHYWYGGEMCTIKTNDKTITIEASGDTNSQLIEKETGRELLYIKDKNNAGALGHELSRYIKTDDELVDAILGNHKEYTLIIQDGNWYECTVRKNINGEVIDNFPFDDHTLENFILFIDDYFE